MRTISVGRWRICAPLYVFAVPYFLWYQFSVVLQYLRQNQLKLMESFGSCMERGFFIFHCLFARRTRISTGVKRIITNSQLQVANFKLKFISVTLCQGLSRPVILLAGRHAVSPGLPRRFLCSSAFIRSFSYVRWTEMPISTMF